MIVYTYSEARTGSLLDVEGIDLGITADEIVEFIREGRRTVYTTDPPADSDTVL